jgi:hypothetical protein
LIEGPEVIKTYEFSVLVTDLEEYLVSLFHHYHDRADCENNFGELKAIAPQLTSTECWSRILAKAMEKFRANIDEGTQIGPPVPT